MDMFTIRRFGLALLLGVWPTACSSQTDAPASTANESDRPAPKVYSSIADDDKWSPLKVEGVTRRIEGAGSTNLAAYQGQGVIWQGVVVSAQSDQLVVGVRTLRVAMKLENLIQYQVGETVEVEGAIDRIDRKSRTVYLARNATAASPR